MNQKRELLLKTALELFYQHGVNSIGINEVIKVSGIAKKTLYSHFDGKNDLVIATLGKRHFIFINWLKSKLEKTTNDQELINVLFASLQSWFIGNEPELGDFRGCFFINTSAEFSDQKSEISCYCRYHKDQVRQLIKSKLTNNSEDLLNTICLLKEGVIVTAYMTGKSADMIQSTLKILQRH